MFGVAIGLRISNSRKTMMDTPFLKKLLKLVLELGPPVGTYFLRYAKGCKKVS